MGIYESKLCTSYINNKEKFNNFVIKCFRCGYKFIGAWQVIRNDQLQQAHRGVSDTRMCLHIHVFAPHHEIDSLHSLSTYLFSYHNQQTWLF